MPRATCATIPRWLDALFSAALAVERAAIALGLGLPFGGSLLSWRRAMAECPAAAPALSVVVPVYNGAATVGELVQALRGAR